MYQILCHFGWDHRITGLELLLMFHMPLYGKNVLNTLKIFKNDILLDINAIEFT